MNVHIWLLQQMLSFKMFWFNVKLHDEILPNWWNKCKRVNVHERVYETAKWQPFGWSLIKIVKNVYAFNRLCEFENGEWQIKWFMRMKYLNLNASQKLFNWRDFKYTLFAHEHPTDMNTKNTKHEIKKKIHCVFTKFDLFFNSNSSVISE